MAPQTVHRPVGGRGQKISDKLVRSLEPPLKGNRVTYDPDIKGFGVRATAAGAKSFVFNYRVRGSGIERRYTIGRWSPKPGAGWSVEAARKEAVALRRRVDRGDDPMGAVHAERAAETVAELVELFRAKHVARKRPATRRDYDRQLDRDIVPALGKMKVGAVTRDDIDRLHRKVSSRAPVQANRVIAVASAMFTFAIRRGWRTDNPASRFERNAEEGRERFLSQAEIVVLGEALAEYPSQSPADVLRFLLLTGARRGEAMQARWADIDMDRGIWAKPSAHTKTKRVHRVPLSAPAMELLTKRREQVAEGVEWVFPGRDASKPIAQVRLCWDWACERAGIKGARIHDLRHTHASILASAGVSLPMVGAILGHTQPRTTARYSHFYSDPLREAVERVGAFVGTAGKSPAQPESSRKGGAA